MSASRVDSIAYSRDAVPAAPAGVPSTRLTGATGAVPYQSWGEQDTRCTSLKKNGEQCQARPIKDSPYCIGHKRFEEARKSLES